jgi:hypothetical protein
MMKSRSLLLAVALAGVVATPPRTLAKTEHVLELRAFAVNMSGVGRAGAGTLDIVIERWTTDEERARLFAVLAEKGPDKLVDALHDVKPRTGYVRTSWSLGWDLGFAREIPMAGGGRRIIIASDRPMGFVEARNQPRSADYEFLLMEIRLGPDGKGEGKLAAAAKIELSREDNTVQVENYGQQPVRLTEVSVVGPKKKKS